MQCQFKGRIEDFIAFLAETVRLHAAAEQIKAEIAVPGIVCVISEERHSSCPELVRRRLGARDCTRDGLSQIAQRFSKKLRVYRFPGLEVNVERCGRVTGRRCDPPQ